MIQVQNSSAIWLVTSRDTQALNRALNKLGVAVDLSVLKRDKIHLLSAKFILCDLPVEKIGYARHAIYRHLERHQSAVSTHL